MMDAAHTVQQPFAMRGEVSVARRPLVASDELKGQLEHVRSVRRIGRRRPHARSRLERYRAEIEALAAAGASSYDIALWLRRFKRTRVHPTTVWRALRRWRHSGA
jgi:hypothetical protein